VTSATVASPRLIAEYERAFYGSQYAMVAPLLEHYGVQLWTPEVGGKVDFASEHDERAMTAEGGLEHAFEGKFPEFGEITQTIVHPVGSVRQH